MLPHRKEMLAVDVPDSPELVCVWMCRHLTEREKRQVEREDDGRVNL